MSTPLPCIFLHGYLGSAADFSGVREALSPRPTLALELFEPDAQFPLDGSAYEILAADLLARIDQTGIQEFQLCGYSLGGRAALHLAAAAPDRVAGLALISAHPGLDEPVERQARCAGDDALAQFIIEDGLEKFLDFWMNLPLFSVLRTSPVAKELRARRDALSAPAAANILQAFSPGRVPPLWDSIVALRCPVRYLAGASDEKYVQIGKRLEREFQIPLTVVANADHAVHLLAPQDVARWIG